MIKIIGSRGVGKTSKLIEISAEKQIPIFQILLYNETMGKREEERISKKQKGV